MPCHTAVPVFTLKAGEAKALSLSFKISVIQNNCRLDQAVNFRAIGL
jgi:hypothetical protein